MTELKPCPFCGSDAELERGNDHHGEWFNLGCSRHWGNVDPDSACIGGRMFYTESGKKEAEAIAAWNTRPDPPADDALVEELRHCPEHVTAKWPYELFREAADRIEELNRLRAADKAKLDAAQKQNRVLQEALVQHNDRLRSAAAIADRDGKETNWLSFRGQCHYTLAEYHELVNDCRNALAEWEKVK